MLVRSSNSCNRTLRRDEYGTKILVLSFRLDNSLSIMTSALENLPAKKEKSLHRYYHRDVEKFVAFVVPSGARVLRADGAIGGAGGEYDYVVMTGIDSVDDLGSELDRARALLSDDGRLVLTYHNHLWKPMFAVAALMRLIPRRERTWFSASDLRSALQVAEFDLVRMDARLLVPFYIPLVSAALNAIGQLPLINHLCLTRYIIARPMQRARREYSVSIVVPARNEKGSIQPIIDRMPIFGSALEIVFIEGHSDDGTWDEIKRVAANYSDPMTLTIAQQDGVGKGDAVRKGFEMAAGEVVMIFDADMTVVPEDMPKFYEPIARGKADIVNGSRLVYPLEPGAMKFLNKLGNSFFALFLSWLIGQRFKDVLCGTKVLRKADYVAIMENRAFFGEFDSFGDLDLLLGAMKRNLKIIDVPVRYHRRDYGVPQIKRFSHGWALLKMCCYAAWRIKS